MDIYCIEPGQSPIETVQIAQANDRLIFPHVDSCLAIIFILANGRFVGGHVPLQMNLNAPLSAGNNARRITTAMLRIRYYEGNGSAINKLITVGDDSYNGFGPAMDYNLNWIDNQVNPVNGYLHLDSGLVVGGVDVFVNDVNHTLRVRATNVPLPWRYSQNINHLPNGVINL